MYIDGHLVKTISEYGSTAVPYIMVFRQTWTSSKTHTIVIRVLGTRGHPRFEIDNILVVR